MEQQSLREIVACKCVETTESEATQILIFMAGIEAGKAIADANHSQGA